MRHTIATAAFSLLTATAGAGADPSGAIGMAAHSVAMSYGAHLPAGRQQIYVARLDRHAFCGIHLQGSTDFVWAGPFEATPVALSVLDTGTWVLSCVGGSDVLPAYGVLWSRDATDDHDIEQPIAPASTADAADESPELEALRAGVAPL